MTKPGHDTDFTKKKCKRRVKNDMSLMTTDVQYKQRHTIKQPIPKPFTAVEILDN